MATKRISQLTQTATEADLVAGNHLVVDTPEGTKKLPADKVVANPTTPATDISAVNLVAKDKTTGDVVKVDGRYIYDIKQTIDNLVGVYGYEQRTKIDWGTETAANKYWNLVDGVAGLVRSTNYRARLSLYEVSAGDILEVTVNSMSATSEGAAAYSAYDNDSLPYDGSVARINFNQKTQAIDNGDGTTTYLFTIPTNCTKIGLFYKGEEVSFYLTHGTPTQWSATLDSHIRDITGDSDSDSYYLKGAAQKSFDKKICILAAGQSNIDGRVPYNEMPSIISAAQPLANSHYIKNNESGTLEQINITGNWAFDLVTYYELLTRANQEIYVIKWSQGGTSIDPLGDSTSHWTADYEEIASGHTSLLKKFENEIRNQISANGSNFDIRAIIWHQGEGDRGSLGTGAADRYYINLRNLIAYLRGIVGNQKLPFITGTISHNSTQFDAKIESAQIRLATEDPYFHLVDMSGAALLDSYHFNATSSEYFGQMCYDALIDYGVITGSKINPTRPW